VDEQVLNLRESLRVVMRYRRVVGVIALVGLIIGLGVAFATPTLVSAKNLVLLPSSPTSSSGTPQRDIQTDVEIALSPTILVPAAKKAGVDLPYNSLSHRVVITSITDDIISIVAKAPSPAQAEKFANAIASQFLNYSSKNASLLESSAEAQLSNEVNSLKSQLAAQKAEIQKTTNVLASMSASNPDYAGQKYLLSIEQGDAYSTGQELVVVGDELSSLENSGSTQGLDASELQSATAATRPSATRIPETGLIGLAVGLLIGLIVAFVKGRSDKRLRQRDEIARAAGVPVLASVVSVRRNKSEDLLGLLEHFEPCVSDKASFRKLLDELGVPGRSSHAAAGPSQNGSSSHPHGVDVLAFVLAGDEKAVAAAAGFPAFAATLGLRVALLVGGSSPSTHQLAIACAARDPLDPGTAPDGVALAVTLEIVDPVTLDVADIEPPAPTSDRDVSALLIVSAGYAKAEEIEVVALASEHHGRPLAGVVVAGPEPSDKTSGQLSGNLIGILAPRQRSVLRSTAR
jgi:capsular polysaccharide biosynthesis protein